MSQIAEEQKLEESDGLPPASSSSIAAQEKPREELPTRVLRPRSTLTRRTTNALSSQSVGSSGSAKRKTALSKNQIPKTNVHSGGDGCLLLERTTLSGIPLIQDDNDQGWRPDAHSSEHSMSQDQGKIQHQVDEEALSNEDVEPAPVYDFRATEETAPRDKCLYSSFFEPPLHQSAEEYCANRDMQRLRRCEVDLFLGTLGLLNVDEVFSVSDVASITEDQLSRRGISSVTFRPNGDACTVETTGSADAIVTITRDEIFTEETIIFNGSVSPHVVMPVDITTYPIKDAVEPLPESDCLLCSEPTTHYQFSSRFEKTEMRHKLIHERPMSTPNKGRMFENIFSADLMLTSSSYGRVFNFLPTPSDFNAAVQLLCDDDDPELPAQRMFVHEIFAILADVIRSSSTQKLLKLYFCLKNCMYDINGKSIRQINVCKE